MTIINTPLLLTFYKQKHPDGHGSGNNASSFNKFETFLYEMSMGHIGYNNMNITTITRDQNSTCILQS